MGTFEVVPGISGGTLAVLLNIYDKLIFSISHLRTNFKNNFKFLITIVLGMGVGIYGFSHVILFLNSNYPIETNCLLLGLIVGLVPMIGKRAVEGGFRVSNFLAFVLTFGVMLFVAYVSVRQQVLVSSGAVVSSEANAVSDLNFVQIFRFVFVGALSAFCLMLPGCSGTMIMLVFGIYYIVIEAIHRLNFLILLPVGLGILLGLIFGSKLIHFCFVNFTKATYFGILGLIVGSAIVPASIAINLLLKIKLSNSSLFLEGFSVFFVHLMVSIGVLVVGAVFSFLFTKQTEKLGDS